jgi:hypothetical protein
VKLQLNDSAACMFFSPIFQEIISRRRKAGAPNLLPTCAAFQTQKKTFEYTTGTQQYISSLRRPTRGLQVKFNFFKAFPGFRANARMNQAVACTARALAEYALSWRYSAICDDGL